MRIIFPVMNEDYLSCHACYECAEGLTGGSEGGGLEPGGEPPE